QNELLESDNGNDTDSYYLPVRSVGSPGAVLHYQEPGASASIDLAVPPGSVATPVPLFIHPEVIEGVQLPCGTALATYAAAVYDAPRNGVSFAPPATLTLSTGCEPDQILGFFKVQGSSLVAQPATVSSGSIIADIDSGGTYLALTATPESYRSDIIA